MMRAVLTAVAIAALIGCKDKDTSTQEPTSRPKRMAARTAAQATKPKLVVLGQSIDWGTLAKKQPGPGRPAAKLSASAIAKPPAQPALTLAKTLAPTGLRPVYLSSANEHYDAYRKALAAEHIFDDIAAHIDAVIALPQVLDIQTSDCGQAGALYDPANRRIVVCYELFAHYLQLFRPTTRSNDQLGTNVIGAGLFAFFHLLGHALIDQWKLATGTDPERAADELAALMLVRAGKNGAAAAYAAAAWFALAGNKPDKQRAPFWSEHGMQATAWSHMLCLIYGSAPQQYPWLVGGPLLANSAATRCAKTYADTNAAWTARLKPHLRPAAATGKDKPPCRVVANHIGRLARQAFRIDTAKLSPADQQERKQLFVPMVRNFVRSAQLACRREWPAARRTCVLRTTRLTRVDGCAGTPAKAEH